MQVSVERTGTLERKLTVRIPAEQVANQINERLAEVSRTARINGFRTGKVPMSVIRQRYGQAIDGEVIQKLIESTYGEAIKQEDLKPAGMPSNIEPAKLNKGEDFEYVATLEEQPEVTVTGLDSVTVEQVTATVEDSDVEAMIGRLQEQRTTYDPVKRMAKKGDQVKLNFEGLVDGEAFPGNTGSGIQFVLGAGQLPEAMNAAFEKGLKGIKTDGETTIEVAYADDHHQPEVAGKTAVYSISEVSVGGPKVPELTDEFAKELGIEDGGLETLRTDLKKNMELELEQRIRTQEKESIIEQLLEKNSVDVPAVMLTSELQNMKQDALQRFGGQGNIDDLPDELFTEQATRRVELGLLFGQIIKEAELKADPERVKELLGTVAAGYESPDEVIRSYMTNPQAMAGLEAAALEEQVMAHVKKQAKIVEKTAAFSDIVKQEQ